MQDNTTKTSKCSHGSYDFKTTTAYRGHQDRLLSRLIGFHTDRYLAWLISKLIRSPK